MKTSAGLRRLLLAGAALVAFATASHASQYAYVPVYNIDFGQNLDQYVAIIDTSTMTVFKTITLPKFPDRAAANPGLGVAYVSSPSASVGLCQPGSISVINTRINQWVASVPNLYDLGGGIVVNSAGTRLYAMIRDCTDPSRGINQIAVIDTVSNSVIATLPGRGVGMALDPSGTRLFLTEYLGVGVPGSVQVYDTTTNAPIGVQIPVGLSPGTPVAHPAGTVIYVPCDDADYVIDVATGTVVDVIPNDQDCSTSYLTRKFFFNNAGTRGYFLKIACKGGVPSIWTMDPKTYGVTLLTQLPSDMAYNTIDLVIDPADKLLYLTGYTRNAQGTIIDGRIWVRDAQTGSLTNTIPGVTDAVHHFGAPLVFMNAVGYCPPGNPLKKPDAIYTVDAAKQIVTDNVTGLVWKQCVEGLSGTACATGSASAMTWSEALTAGATSTFAGYDDWRLPNAKELASLLEPGCYGPSINRNVFPATPQVPHWSSTTYTAAFYKAWQVNFASTVNVNYPDPKANAYAVRLVRGGKSLGGFDRTANARPNPFSFTAQTGVPPSTVATSNPVTLTGFTTTTSVGVSGGLNAQYSINGSFYTSSPGSVTSGSVVRVRQTSSASSLATVTATLTVGGVPGAFSVTSTSAPSKFYTLTPCRAIDTRNISSPSLAPGEQRKILVAGSCSVPATASSIALNVTVVGPTSAGYLTLFPGGPLDSPPLASTINFRSGQVRANNAVVLLGADGKLGIFNGSAGTTPAVIDVVGYFQ